MRSLSSQFKPDFSGDTGRAAHKAAAGAGAVLREEKADDAESGIAALIRQMPCFCYLSEEVIATLAATASLRDASTGEIVFCAGQFEAEDIYCCVEGRGLLTSGMASSGEILRQPFNQGDVLGLEHVLAGKQELARGIALEAEEPLRLIVIEADALRMVITEDHQACVGLLREMARRALAREMGGELGQPSVAMRISRVLCDMARKDDDGAWRIDAMPRHRELGSFVDASEKQAAEAVAQLIALRMLKRDYPGMVITDYPGLMAFSE